MADGGDERREVVGSVGDLDAVVVLLREFLHRSGALRAVALVDRAPGEEPAVVDCGRLAPIEVELGERRVVLPHALELDARAPDLPDVRRLPPFDVDRGEAMISAPLGGVAHLADAVAALAAALGARNVAMVQFETTDPGTPLALTARADASEPMVVALGDDEYELGPSSG
jgi:hypothetical protein